MKYCRMPCMLVILLACCSCNRDGLPTEAKDVRRAVYGWRDYSKYVTATLTKEEYQNYVKQSGYTNVITPSFLEYARESGPIPSWAFEANKNAEWWDISNNELLGSYVCIYDDTSYSLLTYKNGKMYMKYEKW